MVWFLPHPWPFVVPHLVLATVVISTLYKWAKPILTSEPLHLPSHLEGFCTEVLALLFFFLCFIQSLITHSQQPSLDSIYIALMNLTPLPCLISLYLRSISTWDIIYSFTYCLSTSRTRWEKNGNSGRFYFLSLQNYCRQWLQPWLKDAGS